MAGRWGGRSSPYVSIAAIKELLASDASASAGVDLRCDVTDAERPWLVVEWPEGAERRFATKQEAHDHIMSLDDEAFWGEGRGAARDRDRVR